jgi:hypothetical protein
MFNFFGITNNKMNKKKNKSKYEKNKDEKNKLYFENSIKNRIINTNIYEPDKIIILNNVNKLDIANKLDNNNKFENNNNYKIDKCIDENTNKIKSKYSFLNKFECLYSLFCFTNRKRQKSFINENIEYSIYISEREAEMGCTQKIMYERIVEIKNILFFEWDVIWIRIPEKTKNGTKLFFYERGNQKNKKLSHLCINVFIS